MTYLNRLWRQLRAALGPAVMPPTPLQLPLEKRPYVEPAIPAAFKRAPIPRPPEHPDWKVVAPKQYFLYTAREWPTYIDQGYTVKGHENYCRPIPAELAVPSPYCAESIIRARSTNMLFTLRPEILRCAVPTQFNIYWWWYRQSHPDGTYIGKDRRTYPINRDDIQGDVYWIGSEPILKAAMMCGEMGVEHGGMTEWAYITRLKLPQPTLTLQQTIQITPELTSELKGASQ